MNLSKKEEELMEIIWNEKTPFMKDIIDRYNDPKPATTTIATLLKRLQDKDFVGYELFGNSRRYYALVEKDSYFSKQVKGMIKNFFNNSTLQFASFFTSSSDMSEKELEELKQMVDNELNKRKQ